MAFNFPSNPTLNDTYSFNGKTWRFNGNAWQYASEQISITTTGNITANNILSDNYFFSNGDPFISGGGSTAANLVIGTRISPIYVALATDTTLDVVGRSSNVTVTLTT